MKLTFFLLLLLPSFCFAQVVNVEAQRARPKRGFNGIAQLGGSLQKGNVNAFQYSGSLRASYTYKRQTVISFGHMAYEEQSSNVFKNEKMFHLRLSSMWFKNFGTEVFGQIQMDEFKALSVRQLGGVGLRFTPLDEFMALGLGAMSTYEEYIGGDRPRVEPRLTSYFNVSEEIGKMIGSFTAYYQPLVADLSDYRLNGILMFETFINRHLSFVNEINCAYDSRPPIDVEMLDIGIVFKVKYRWRPYRWNRP